MSGTPTNTVLNGAVFVTATDNFGCTGTREHDDDRPAEYRPRELHRRRRQYAVRHWRAFPVDAARGLRRYVKTGDNGPGALFVTFPATSTNGGTIVEARTDGTFTYTRLSTSAGRPTPSPTVTDANGVTNIGTVTINLCNIVWYVNGTGGAGDGRSHIRSTLERRGHAVRIDTHHLRALGRRHNDGESGDRRDQSVHGQGATSR